MAINTCKKVTTIKNEKGIGAAAMCAWQRGSGNYLALRFEGIFSVFIYDRQGGIHKKISIPTNCSGLEWDADGDVLAILVDTPGSIILWEAHSGKVQEIETGLKDSGTILSWSVVGKILAYGTLKGSIMVYNHQTLRKIPVVGKHTKKIVCCKWSKDEIVAFGTTDDQVSLNTQDGDLIKYLQLRGKPCDLQFGHIKEDSSPNSTSDNTVSCIVGDRILYLFKYDDFSTASPMELGFQTRYGNILSHHWHGDGYILVSFMGGFVVLLSSHYKEIGTELVLCELKDDILRHCSLNSKRGWLALCCGQSTIQILEASEPKTTLSVTEVQDVEGRLRPIVKCNWTEDGQLLAVTNTAGDVVIYLTSVPLLGGSNVNQLAAMSSLTDCVLYSLMGSQILPEFTFTLQMEPTRIALGPLHLATIIHSSVSLYNTRVMLAPLTSTPVVSKEFNSNVQEFVLNQMYCAARCGDKAYLHRIEGNGLEKFDVKIFPETNTKKFRITSIAIAKETFLYGGENGTIKMFHVEKWTEILSVEIPSLFPIKGLFPDPTGGQCVIVDKRNAGFYFDVLTTSISEASGTIIRTLNDFPHRCDGVLWDTDFNSGHIFLTFALNSSKAHLYSAWKDLARGIDAEFVGQYDMFKQPEYRPFCLKKGAVFALTGNGKVVKSVSLYQDEMGVPGDSQDTDEILKRLVTLRLFNEAWDFCSLHSSPENWSFLGKAALETGQLDIAIRAYTKIPDIGMVYTLRRIALETDELPCLHGDVAFVLGDFDLAESRYLESGQNEKALGLRRDLHEWDKAMDIAVKFSSNSVTDVAREYASTHEHNGDYGLALELFKKAKATLSVPSDEEWNQMSDEKQRNFTTKVLHTNKGLARNMIRNGLHADAMEIITQTEDMPFSFECAEILDHEKEYERAAKLYEFANEEVKAASCYIRLKEFAKAEEILRRNFSALVWRQLGKAKEVEGQLVEAARAYSEGLDCENGIRLYLELGIPEEAGSLAKVSDDPQDSAKVAAYYQSKGELEKSLEYLIHSECYEEALYHAFKHGKTEFYVEFIHSTFKDGIPDGFEVGILQVAGDFEAKKDHFRAGKCYLYVGNYDKAFTVLLKAVHRGVQADEEQVFEKLTDAVILSENDNYGRQLVELFLGEKGGVSKDPKYLYNYYLKAGKIIEACKTALVVAKSEQALANFQGAHQIIVQAIQKLLAVKEKVPKDLVDTFNILHSYFILRLLLERGDKLGAARISIRLSDNVTQFSTAAPKILTLGVTLCQQVNLKNAALTLAFPLVRDHREEIDAKYKPQIEQMVRKQKKSDHTDDAQAQSPCPYCNQNVDEYSLNCKECMSLIPLCCVSGKHIVASDLCICPSCEFPLTLSEMENITSCPVCKSRIDSSELKRINDPGPFLYEGGRSSEQ